MFPRSLWCLITLLEPPFSLFFIQILNPPPLDYSSSSSESSTNCIQATDMVNPPCEVPFDLPYIYFSFYGTHNLQEDFADSIEVAI